MPTLEAIQEKIKKLQAQAQAIAAREAAGALERIRNIVEKHGLSVADIEAHLNGRKRRGKSATGARTHAAKPAGSKGKLPPKYRDPKTGATWSGHARPPAWIANVKDRSKFLIAGADAGDHAGNGVAKAATRRATKQTTKRATTPVAKKTSAKKPAAKKAVSAKRTAAARKAAAQKTVAAEASA